MKSIKSSRQVLRVLRGLLATVALGGIGLAAAGCGAGGAPAISTPPASGHTAAERAAVMTWLAETNQMWTHRDFAAVDQITTASPGPAGYCRISCRPSVAQAATVRRTSGSRSGGTGRRSTIG